MATSSKKTAENADVKKAAVAKTAAKKATPKVAAKPAAKKAAPKAAAKPVGFLGKIFGR